MIIDSQNFKEQPPKLEEPKQFSGFLKEDNPKLEFEEKNELYQAGYEKGKNWVINNPSLFGLSEVRNSGLVPLERESVLRWFLELRVRSDIHPTDYAAKADDLCAKFGRPPLPKAPSQLELMAAIQKGFDNYDIWDILPLE